MGVDGISLKRETEHLYLGNPFTELGGTRKAASSLKHCHGSPYPLAALVSCHETWVTQW